MSEHVERDGVWQYTALNWAWGCGGAGGNKEEEGGLPRSTCPSSCLPPAGNSLAISSRCRVPTSSRRAMACSSSFRCGHLVVCPHPSTRGGAMTWRLRGGSVAVYGAVTWQTTPLLLDWSPSHEGPARTRPHMSTCRFPQSGGRREGNGSRVLGWKKRVINN